MSNMCMILKPLHLGAGGELIKKEGTTTMKVIFGIQIT